MPLPPSAIDQFRRDVPHTPAWSGRLFMFSLTVCLAAIGIGLGLRFGYEPYLASRVASLDREMKTFTQEIPIESQETIVRFYSQLTNLRGLLSNRAETSRLLAFLEASTLPSVYYERAEWNGRTRELTLEGKARTVSDATAQVRAFQGAPGLERVDVKRVASDPSNLWGFQVALTFSSSFLTAPISAAPASAPAPAPSSATSSTTSSTTP